MSMQGHSQTLQPNFAFSSYFGSGLYNNGGTDVTVFNIPLSFNPDWEGMDYLQDARLRAPVSIGFSNFDIERIDQTEVDSDTSTLSIGIGLEKDFWEMDETKLVPFFDIGYAEDFASNRVAFTYAIGTELLHYLRFWDAQQILYGKVQHAGFVPFSNTEADDFTSIQAGIDVKIANQISIGSLSTFISLYTTSYYYALGLYLEQADTPALRDQWAQEVGFTWGLEEKIETALADIERIGLGYRFSPDGDGLIRLTFNFPLD